MNQFSTAATTRQTKIRPRDQVDANGSRGASHAVFTTPLTTPPPGENDVVTKSRGARAIHSKNGYNAVEIVLPKFLAPHVLKRWRKEHHLSAKQLATRLGYSRTYIKKIESGALRASQKFIDRLDALKADLANVPFEPEPPKPRTVITRFELPPTFELDVKPRRCKGCGAWFVPHTPNQRTHSKPKCQLAARRKARRKASARMSTKRGPGPKATRARMTHQRKSKR